MGLNTLLERLKEIDAKSGGDCECHCMMTCPDKAQEYWGYFDEFLPTLIQIIETQALALRVYSRLGPDMDKGLVLWDGGQAAKDAIAKVEEIANNGKYFFLVKRENGKNSFRE